MVELVIERYSPERAFAVEHRQWSEGTRFVDVAAIAVFSAFRDGAFALPQELGGVVVDGFLNTTAEGVVLVENKSVPFLSLFYGRKLVG